MANWIVIIKHRNWNDHINQSVIDVEVEDIIIDDDYGTAAQIAAIYDKSGFDIESVIVYPETAGFDFTTEVKKAQDIYKEQEAEKRRIVKEQGDKEAQIAREKVDRATLQRLLNKYGVPTNAV